MTADIGMVDSEPEQKRRTSPGEEMACLDIAVGFLGVLLIIFPALTSLRGLHATVAAAGLALVLGLAFAIAGGFLGLSPRPERRARAARVMKLSALLLTVTSIVLLIASSDGLIGWDFPVGVIFLTLALFADLAAWRFGKATSVEIQ